MYINKKIKLHFLIMSIMACVMVCDANIKNNIDASNLQKIEKTNYEKLNENKIVFEINTTPYAESDKSECNFLINNPKENNNQFIVEIYDKTNGELIYKSKNLKPGDSIDKEKLKKKLKKGKYNCVATFSAYSLSDNHFLGKVSAELTLTILK